MRYSVALSLLLSGLAAAVIVVPTAQAQPRPGFDCTKAASAVDRLICSDDTLAGLDRTLAVRYEALHHSVSPEGFSILRKGQLACLASRSDCVQKDASRDQSAACLREAYTERTNELNTRYKSAGSLSI